MRQHREQQNVSIATIADRTKIKASLLEAFERDDISQWPPGIFRRAYIRAYASAIGLEPDAVIREFLEVYPEPVEVVETPPPPTGLRGLVGSAIGSLSRIRHTGGSQLHAETPRAPAPVEDRVKGPTETVPTMGRIPSPGRVAARVNPQVDLLSAARLCTELGRVETAAQVQPLLREAAAILDATGLIVWVWNPPAAELRPVLVHGYSEQAVTRLGGVGRNDDNATAAAFRLAQTLSVRGTGHTSGALALPLMTPTSCAGVLTIELRHGSEETASVRAVATFFAAMLAQLVGGGTPAAAEPEQRPTEASAVAGA